MNPPVTEPPAELNRGRDSVERLVRMDIGNSAVPGLMLPTCPICGGYHREESCCWYVNPNTERSDPPRVR